MHITVETLGHFLMLHVTPADEPHRPRVKQLAELFSKSTCNNVEVAFVDHQAAGQATRHGIDLLEVKYTEAKEDVSCCRIAGG